MKTELKTGAALASAIALLLGASHPVQAAAKEKEAAKKVKCVGGNECKGKSACMGANNGCEGQNGCKGKGWVMSTSEKACETAHGKVVSEKA